MKHISVTILGVAPSGNSRNSYSSRGGAVHVNNTVHTKRYKESAALQAYRQCQLKSWVPIKYGWLAVSIYNHRFDRDNACKVPFDAMQGTLYEDDAYILDGPIRLVKDKKGPRIMFDVVEVAPEWYNYAKPKNKYEEPLSHEEWVELHMKALFE